MRVATVFSLSIVFELAGVLASAVSWDSPVSVSETQLGTVASTHMKAVFSHLVKNYTLSNAPVYREGYPLYRYYIAFPKNKAARISYEEQELLDAGGDLCLGKASENKTLQQGIDGSLTNFIYTDRREDGGFSMTSTNIDGEFDIQDKTKIFKLTILAKYNVPIVVGTTCYQVQMTVHGTMVSTEQTNPTTNAAEIITTPSQASKLLSLQAAVVLFALINTLCD